jgi:hypothetical protein
MENKQTHAHMHTLSHTDIHPYNVKIYSVAVKHPIINTS